ncbi:helix-turn-helix domain-containing protein [Hyphococcus sp.]|jgi:transcriptional regulator with XRE-family HTH domain|uniref:helix-turn-helix domain-containing protein n=1 Tax=Hyphococcus sp. TaxID=2038636 RepID=UPI003D0F06B8
MQREVDWIIEALERDPAKTQTGLAAALGIDKSGVSRMLKGRRRLKYEEAQRAAEYLELNPAVIERAGLAESETHFLPEEGQETLAPLYESAAGENGKWLLDLQRPIERRPQARDFAGAALVFGFYAPDESMGPRFHTGEVVWVNPARPPAAGHDALLLAKNVPPSETAAYLCVLQETTSSAYRISQYGVRGMREFPLSGWRAAYVYGRI